MTLFFSSWPKSSHAAVGSRSNCRERRVCSGSGGSLPAPSRHFLKGWDICPSLWREAKWAEWQADALHRVEGSLIPTWLECVGSCLGRTQSPEPLPISWAQDHTFSLIDQGQYGKQHDVWKGPQLKDETHVQILVLVLTSCMTLAMLLKLSTSQFSCL